MSIIVDEVRLPEDIERGASVGPMFQTSIVALSSGKEDANQDWQEDLIVADIAWGMMPDEDASSEDIENGFKRIFEFFVLRRGRHRGFLFRNPLDSEGLNQVMRPNLAVPRTFQLTKTWQDSATSYTKRITRPVDASIVLAHNGTVIPRAGGSGVPAWQHVGKGVIQFAADAPAGIYTASYTYDVPMRFETDNLRIVLESLKAGEVPEITIQQIRE